MIRFIDLTEAYWTDRHPENNKICAFLSTVTDRFLETEDGQHTFSDMEEIEEHPQADRLKRLMPENFFG